MFGLNRLKYLQYMPSKLQLMLKQDKPMILDVSVVHNITGRIISQTPLCKDDMPSLSRKDLYRCSSNQVRFLSYWNVNWKWQLFWFAATTESWPKIRLVVVESKLGCILGGCFHAGNEILLYWSEFYAWVWNQAHICSPLLTLCYWLLDQFWNLEALGITESPSASDDDQAIAHFNQMVHFAEGRYMVTWPWKERVPDLSNYQLAFGRLKSMLQKLVKS